MKQELLQKGERGGGGGGGGALPTSRSVMGST